MPPDPELIAEVRAWLAKAQQDMRMARLAADAQPPLFGQAAYHAQQAAEKAMKAFLTWHKQVFGKTHNLVALGRACAAVDADLDELLLRASMLTDYAWKYRYPGEPAEPSEAETREALALAAEVQQAIRSRIPPEVQAP